MAAANGKEDLSERTFEQNWVIRNWNDKIYDEKSIENTSTEIQCEVENLIIAKFLVGTKLFLLHDNRWVRFYWKLIHKHYCLTNLEAYFVGDVLNGDGIANYTLKSQASAEIGTPIIMTDNMWRFSSNPVGWINSEGSLILKLKITLKNLPDFASYFKEEEHRVASKNELSQHLAALVNDKLSSDVKIITKEKIELFAHKTILNARCPAFLSKFDSNLTESFVVNVDDISAKTMNILLKYWYTGEVSPSWKENDVVLEFTNAIGKYQINSLSKMIDDMLGRDLMTSDLNVDLLRMVQKWSLKNAEDRILKKVVHQISQAMTGAEILELFSWGSDKMKEETFVISQVLKQFDDVLSENNEDEASFLDVKLMALACKYGMKNVEGKFLKRIIHTVKKVTCADDLFTLFEQQAETGEDDCKTNDLLVRSSIS